MLSGKTLTFKLNANDEAGAYTMLDNCTMKELVAIVILVELKVKKQLKKKENSG